MSGSSFYRNRNPLDFLNALDGARIPGGCPDCGAEQAVDATDAPIYRVIVYHDNTCPAYRGHPGEAMTAPVVRLDSARGLRGTVWLLEVRCPYCARIHTHGGGIDRTRIADFLGDRVSHCGAGNYTLTDPDGVLP